MSTPDDGVAAVRPTASLAAEIQFLREDSSRARLALSKALIALAKGKPDTARRAIEKFFTGRP